MVRDAESHAEEDRRLKELAEARNNAEQVVYATEKSLAEHEDKLDEETKSDIRGKIDAVKGSLESEDAADIRSKLEALREASFKLGELVYQQAQASAGGAAEGSPATAPVTAPTRRSSMPRSWTRSPVTARERRARGDGGGR